MAIPARPLRADPRSWPPGIVVRVTSLLGPADASDPTALLPIISQATQRLTATARDLADDEWATPSLCAGWSRSHVLAHVALNAEAIAGVVRGLTGEAAPMYASAEVRDADIAGLAAAGPNAIRERLARSSADLSVAFPSLLQASPDSVFEITPGSASRSAGMLALMRLREVEIHHADLDLDATWEAWPESTAAAFIAYDAPQWAGAPVRLVADDVDGATWTVGTPSGEDLPEVRGPLRALAWWISGRDAGAVLSSSSGELPKLEA